MLFEVKPEQIQALDAKQLPQLMARLIFAEAQKVDIPLYHATIPMQITVPDGGEDGRIEWSGGDEQTDYFPSRFVLFQSKAKKSLPASSVKAEIAKKKVSNKQIYYEPSEAIKTVIANKGSYVLFTSAPMVTKTIGERKRDIREAIKASGLNADECTAIEIYDANKIANWVNTHSPVALWVNETLSSNNYSGFLTHTSWGKYKDNHLYKWIDKGDDRFNVAGGAVPPSAATATQSKCSYMNLQDNFLKHIVQEQKIVRICGASGLGKSRLAFELFNNRSSIQSQSIATSLVYCNAYIGSEKILSFTNGATISKQRVIIVVDDCEDSLHHELTKNVSMQDSKCSLVTIGTESKVQASANTMTVMVEKASDETIKMIIEQGDKNKDDLLIIRLAEGFPRMATLALEALRENSNPITKTEEIVERILWGNKTPDNDDLSALCALCLFGYLGCDNDKYSELQEVAKKLTNIASAQMYSGLQRFIARGVVVRIGDYFKAQPLILMLKLAAEYLEALSPVQRNYLLNSMSGQLYRRFLSQVQWLDASAVAQKIAERLLSNQYYGNLKQIVTKQGSETLLTLVNVTPDIAMDTLNIIFNGTSNEELYGIKDGRQNIVWTLEKLAFPKKTFARAARLLLRLAANENEHTFSNNATHYFCQLYHLQLSGTEAEPALRLQILDEGLSSGHGPTISVCLKALKAMLETYSFTRSSGSERLGSRPSLTDWQPKTYEEIYDYYRQTLKRLLVFATQTGPNAKFAIETISKSIHGLLGFEAMFDDIKYYSEKIKHNINAVYAILSSLHSWLYFNSDETPNNFRKKVKKLAKELIPTSQLEQLIILTKGYPIDFYDPDTTYKKGSSVTNFDYMVREGNRLAECIAMNQNTAMQAAIKISSDTTLNSPFSAMRRLAECSQNPVEIFLEVIRYLDENKMAPNTNALAGFVSGITFNNSDDAKKCINMVLSSQHLRKHALQIIGTQKITKESLDIILSLVQEGSITAYSCIYISHGDRLKHLEFNDIKDFLLGLEECGDEGLIAVLEIVGMYIFDDKPLSSSDFSRYLKNMLLNEKSYTVKSAMKAHYLIQIYKKLRSSGFCDHVFVNALAKRLFTRPLTQFLTIFDRYHSAQSDLIHLCIQDHPTAVWEALTNAFENGSAEYLFNYREEGAIPQKDNVFCELSEDLYLPWVNEKAERRLPFVLKWIPLTEKCEDKLCWHPKVITLFDQIDCPSDTFNSILSRMYPDSWTGSRAPYLERFVPLLEELEKHPKPQVNEWACSALSRLKIEIADTRKRDEEEELRYT